MTTTQRVNEHFELLSFLGKALSQPGLTLHTIRASTPEQRRLPLATLVYTVSSRPVRTHTHIQKVLFLEIQSPWA